MFTHVIFDLDGTLLDTLADLAAACNWVCRQHGWPEHPVEEYKTFVGNGAPKLLERVAPQGTALTDALRAQALEEFTRRYNAHKEDRTRVYGGMPQALERMKGAGLTLAVLSNKPHAAAVPVVERYYPGVFAAVQGALPGLPVKPDPALLSRLMADIGAPRESTLFVGDSNVDIRTAKNGGLPGCGVLWGFRTREELEAEGADFIVQAPAELAGLVLGR